MKFFIKNTELRRNTVQITSCSDLARWIIMPDEKASSEEILAFLSHADSCPYHSTILDNADQCIAAAIQPAYEKRGGLKSIVFPMELITESLKEMAQVFGGLLKQRRLTVLFFVMALAGTGLLLSPLLTTSNRHRSSLDSTPPQALAAERYNSSSDPEVKVLQDSARVLMEMIMALEDYSIVKGHINAFWESGGGKWFALPVPDSFLHAHPNDDESSLWLSFSFPDSSSDFQGQLWSSAMSNDRGGIKVDLNDNIYVDNDYHRGHEIALQNFGIERSSLDRGEGNNFWSDTSSKPINTFLYRVEGIDVWWTDWSDEALDFPYIRHPGGVNPSGGKLFYEKNPTETIYDEARRREVVIVNNEIYGPFWEKPSGTEPNEHVLSGWEQGLVFAEGSQFLGPRRQLPPVVAELLDKLPNGLYVHNLEVQADHLVKRFLIIHHPFKTLPEEQNQ